jgi:hypothetical protein
MANRKAYFPQKTFDDDLDAFAQLGSAAGWVFTGVDFAQLKQDAVDQRGERAKFDATELEYNRTREAFSVTQEARYVRFAAALNAARGAFRSNKVVLAQLDRFRRSSKRSSQIQAQADEQKEQQKQQ